MPLLVPCVSLDADCSSRHRMRDHQRERGFSLSLSLTRSCFLSSSRSSLEKRHPSPGLHSWIGGRSARERIAAFSSSDCPLESVTRATVTGIGATLSASLSPSAHASHSSRASPVAASRLLLTSLSSSCDDLFLVDLSSHFQAEGRQRERKRVADDSFAPLSLSHTLCDRRESVTA